MGHTQYSFVLYKGHSLLFPVFRNMAEEFVLPSVSDVMLWNSSITNYLNKSPQEDSPSY